MSLSLSKKNKETIKQVFDMYAVNEKIDQLGLDKIFEMIGYKVSADQLADIKKMLFDKKANIDFNKFLELFKLQLNDLTKDDIKCAFKVLGRL